MLDKKKFDESVKRIMARHKIPASRHEEYWEALYDFVQKRDDSYLKKLNDAYGTDVRGAEAKH
jgi:hypothetical protein